MRTLTTIALGLMLVLGSSSALAQEPSHEGTTATPAPSGSDQPMEPAHPMGPGGMGGKGMSHGMGMGQQGMGKDMCMGAKDMQTCMQTMRDHTKMMEGITDPKKLDTEMKKHMRMMDDMMESMMKGQPSSPPASTKP